MQTFIVLLRGINVSGHNKLPMKELKALLEGLGLQQVRTYIQSGNVVLEAPDAGGLAGRISEAIRQQFGYEVPVAVRSREEWQELIAANPFTATEDISRLHVSLLEAAPEEALVAKAMETDSGDDRMQVTGRAVYLHCPHGYGNTKLNNNFLERRLRQMATTRNWKTVLELGRMAGCQ